MKTIDLQAARGGDPRSRLVGAQQALADSEWNVLQIRTQMSALQTDWQRCVARHKSRVVATDEAPAIDHEQRRRAFVSGATSVGAAGLELVIGAGMGSALFSFDPWVGAGLGGLVTCVVAVTIAADLQRQESKWPDDPGRVQRALAWASRIAGGLTVLAIFLLSVLRISFFSGTLALVSLTGLSVVLPVLAAAAGLSARIESQCNRIARDWHRLQTARLDNEAIAAEMRATIERLKTALGLPPSPVQPGANGASVESAGLPEGAHHVSH